MAVYNSLPAGNATVASRASTSTTVGTTETTLLSVTAPSAGKYLILATVTWTGSGSQNKDIFLRIRNSTSNNEELAQGYWYAGYQSQTGGAGNMTIFAVSDLSAGDVITETLRVSSNTVRTAGITNLTAIRL